MYQQPTKYLNTFRKFFLMTSTVKKKDSIDQRQKVKMDKFTLPNLDDAQTYKSSEEQEKTIQEIVSKLKMIGDEFNKQDSPFKDEFSKLIKSYLKDNIFIGWKQKLYNSIDMMNLFE